MKIAEVECPNCKVEFKITFSNGTPHAKFLICPICSCEECRVKWIDKDET